MELIMKKILYLMHWSGIGINKDLNSLQKV
jgi:hypothetical protein